MAAAKRDDLFVFISRGFVYAGMFCLTLLRFKVTQGLNLSDGLFVVAAGFLLLSRRPPKAAPKAPAWYFGGFLFLIAAVLASFQAGSKAGSLLVVGNAIYLFFVLAYVLRQHLGQRIYMRRAVVAFVLGTTISALVAICQVTLHIFLLAPSLSGASASIGGGNSRAVGLSTQPNLAGVAFALAIVFAVGMLSFLGVRRHGYLVVCVVVLAMALLLSASVSGLGSTIVGLIALFIARGFSLRKILTVVLSLVVAYVLVFGVFDRGSHLDPITRVQKTLNSSGGQNSGTVQLRIDTIKASWDGITQSPIIGHGLDQKTLGVYYAKYLYVYYPAHNLIFLYWYGGGILMLLALFVLVGSSFNRLLSGWRKRGATMDPMRGVVLAGCISVLFYAMQGPEIVDRWFWIPFLLAICFRDDLAEPPDLSQARAAKRPVLASSGSRVRSNGHPRRVSGTVGSAATWPS